MDELREEIGVQMSLTGRLMKFRLRWAGHLVRMEEERMAKRADRLRKRGTRKRGRQQLRLEDLCEEGYQEGRGSWGVKTVC